MNEAKFGSYRKGYQDALRDVMRAILELPDHADPHLEQVLGEVERLLDDLDAAGRKQAEPAQGLSAPGERRY